MNTREQLNDLHSRLKHMKENRVAVPLLDSDEELIAQLIAERPYEEKDTIMVRHKSETFWYEAQYIASCSSGVVALRDGAIGMFSQHKSATINRIESDLELCELDAGPECPKCGDTGEKPTSTVVCFSGEKYTLTAPCDCKVEKSDEE